MAFASGKKLASFAVIALVCRRCHAPRTLWFRITLPAAN